MGKYCASLGVLKGPWDQVFAAFWQRYPNPYRCAAAPGGPPSSPGEAPRNPCPGAPQAQRPPLPSAGPDVPPPAPGGARLAGSGL